MNIRQNVAFASDGLTDEDLREIAEWVSDSANWANHNAEGLCFRGEGKVTTPAKKKRPVAALEPEAPSEEEGFESLAAALNKGIANADELGLGRAKGPITPEKAKKKAKKALA